MERVLKRIRRRLCPRLKYAPGKALPGEDKARTKSAPNPLQNTLHGKRALDELEVLVEDIHPRRSMKEKYFTLCPLGFTNIGSHRWNLGSNDGAISRRASFYMSAEKATGCITHWMGIFRVWLTRPWLLITILNHVGRPQRRYNYRCPLQDTREDRTHVWNMEEPLPLSSQVGGGAAWCFALNTVDLLYCGGDSNCYIIAQRYVLSIGRITSMTALSQEMT